MYLKKPEAFSLSLPGDCSGPDLQGQWRLEEKEQKRRGLHHLEEDANSQLFVHCHFSEERLKLVTEERLFPSFSDYYPAGGTLACNW